MDSFLPLPDLNYSPEHTAEESLIPPQIATPPALTPPQSETSNFPREFRPDTSATSNLDLNVANGSSGVNSISGALSGSVHVVSNPDALAVVPAPGNLQNLILSNRVSNRATYWERSSELVKFTDLTANDQRYHGGLVRKTRMLFNALRIYSTADEGKRLASGFHGRTRGDLKASGIMREHGLWLNRDKRIVGAIPGVEIGDVFFFRVELCILGLHGLPHAEIDYLHWNSSGEPIATSIIFSSESECEGNVVDTGDVIVYTGRNKGSKEYCGHQKLEGGILGLERSLHCGTELRVVRGFRYEGSASGKIYVYDGLYRVVDCWFDLGRSGFGVYKFRMVRLGNQPQMGSALLRLAQDLRIRPLAFRPWGYVCLDMSMKKENVPVLLFNDIDNDRQPLGHQYLVKSVIPCFVYNAAGSNAGCNCVSGCSSGCFCAMKNGGEFAYDEKGILIQGKALIFECGPYCSCPPTCRNRVTQKGVRNRFEVFRSRENGWGLRSFDLVQAGAFLCEYAGVVLTQDQAQVVSMAGDDNLVYPRRFPERWTEWGDFSQVCSDYVRPLYPPLPPLDFAVDVSSLRNVACYVKHSTTPNVMLQFVLYDHNSVIFPRLMLFAMESIPPLREFSLDYGLASC